MEGFGEHEGTAGRAAGGEWALAGPVVRPPDSARKAILRVLVLS